MFLRILLISILFITCKEKPSIHLSTEETPYLSRYLDSITDSKLLEGKPILIVDGNFISSYEKNNGWFLLRKDDIRELEYMVDSNSVKLYGVRGKNGAILINTKLLEYKSKPNNEKSIFVLDGKVISYSEYKKIDFSKVNGIATITDKATIILYGSDKNDQLIYITTKIPTE